MLVLVSGATGRAGEADMCLACREGSEGLVCPADTSMTTRSSSWGGRHSGTCLGCTPCELAPPRPRPPPPTDPLLGVLLMWPRSLSPDPLGAQRHRRPSGSFRPTPREPPSGHCVHGSPGPPLSPWGTRSTFTRPQPHPRGRRWASGPPAWERARGPSGSGSTRPAGLLSRWAVWPLGWGPRCGGSQQ